MVDTTGVHYTISDHLSSASVMVGGNGVVEQTMDYLPFGGERVNVKTGVFDARHTYTDQEKDAESGLLY